MSLFICFKCGYGAASWLGRCPDCGEWNSLKEKQEDERKRTNRKSLKLTPLAKIQSENKQRKKTGIFEFDRVLDGGIVPGGVILLTGEPGIGKTTLLLQALKNLKTVYLSGEESAQQVTERAKRLRLNLKNLVFSDTLHVDEIIEGIETQKDSFDALVIDSVQTLRTRGGKSKIGGINELRESVNQLIRFAKKADIALIMIGHVTKGGQIAGPKTLEHFVDCVLMFEGDKVSHHRILRASKNRFGSVDEIGIFEMRHDGLSEVNNPLAFLEPDDQGASAGKTIVGTAEGKRSLFFEIQTLAVSTTLAYPRRVVKGVDYNKVLLLLAVIRKQLGIPIDRFDIYVNVAGGVSVKSTAADLGIAASLLSSIKNIPIPKKTVFIGEVGLLGEIRSVPYEEKIVREARRLRFQKILTPPVVKHVKDLGRILSV
ncbi:DNA repair protein RadA [Candidatus Roizmanbacteria bacterium]|nr:DNA repair protein RadA [Candidatus Roizmanbacteria bacterium]